MGTYGEKTWHLGLEQLVHSIWGAQSSRDISVNTVSKRESFREIAQTLAQPQMFTGLSPAPAAPPRCAGGGALLSPGPGQAGRRRASQESMAATASCSSGTPQPSSRCASYHAGATPQWWSHDSYRPKAVLQEPSQRQLSHALYQALLHATPWLGVQILIADQRLWASRVRTPQPPAPRSVDPLPGRATLGKLLNASSGRLGSITHSDSRKGK